MATERANDLKAFRDFAEEQLGRGGAELTLEEALARWADENAPAAERVTTGPAVRGTEPNPSLEELIDLEFEAFCAREGDDAISLEAVRAATAKVPGSMAEAIIEDERADRFGWRATASIQVP